MAVVVSDTSPIRALGHLNCLEWLNELFFEVVIPPAVEHELRSPPAGLPSIDFSRWTFITKRAPREQQRVEDLSAILDRGESEAIVLAEELQSTAILMDELAGREIATRRGLTVVGTLGVLVRAKQQGLCDQIWPLLDRLQDEIHFFIAPALKTQILKQAGESEP